MGLDHGVYRMQRFYPEDGKVYKSGSDELSSALHFLKSCAGEGIYADIVPFCTEILVENEYLDREKIEKDFGLATGTSRLSYIEGTRVGMKGLALDGEKKEICIAYSDVEANYTQKKIEEELACTCADDVAIWRKRYDIQNWFYENIENIENCGYYILNAEMIRRFNKTFKGEAERLPEEDPTEDSALFYWEWH